MNDYIRALSNPNAQVVVVACETADDAPELVPVVRHDSERDVEEDMHCQYAQKQVSDMGYDVHPQAICFDEDDMREAAYGQQMAFYSVLLGQEKIDGYDLGPETFATDALFSEEYDELNLDALSEDSRPDHEIAEDFVRWDVADALESGWPISETGEEMYLCGYYNAITKDIRFFPDPVKR